MRPAESQLIDSPIGPIIGPLVLAGVVITLEKEKELELIGVKDSKLLTPKKREELYSKILKIADSHSIIILEPDVIDGALNSSDMNLNWLEANTSADIINELNPNKAIIDSPSNNVKAYKSYMIEKIKNKKINLIVEHKADLNHIVVAAASILAKVTRDKEMKKIEKSIGKKIGSGYPADPRTKQFLEENWDKHPDFIRQTWTTYKNIVKKQHQKDINEFL